jgi:hypothetical protein
MHSWQTTTRNCGRTAFLYRIQHPHFNRFCIATPTNSIKNNFPAHTLIRQQSFRKQHTPPCPFLQITHYHSRSFSTVLCPLSSCNTWRMQHDAAFVQLTAYCSLSRWLRHQGLPRHDSQWPGAFRPATGMPVHCAILCILIKANYPTWDGEVVVRAIN